MDAVLAQINQEASLPELLSADYILATNTGVINAKFCAPFMIDYALSFIADEVYPGQFRLSTAKTTKAIALVLLYLKGDFFLSEFLAAFRHALELGLPVGAEADAPAEDPSGNLYEHFTGADLSFLRGTAVIVPARELRAVNKRDDVIRLLHPFYSQEFQLCALSPEKRL